MVTTGDSPWLKKALRIYIYIYIHMHIWSIYHNHSITIYHIHSYPMIFPLHIWYFHRRTPPWCRSRSRNCSMPWARAVPCAIGNAWHWNPTRPAAMVATSRWCYWEMIFVRDILETNDDYVWNANHQHMDLFDFTFLDTDVTRRNIGISLI